jgi:hypothetical protein
MWVLRERLKKKFFGIVCERRTVDGQEEGCVRGQPERYIENRSRRATRRGPSNLLAPHQTLFLRPIPATDARDKARGQWGRALRR